MNMEKIERINELTRISRERELTQEEMNERSLLRQEYIDSIKRNLKSHLDNTYVVDDKGNKRKLGKNN